MLDRIQNRIMSSERNFSISIILFFLLFMGGLVYQNIRFQQRVKAEYAGKLIKLDSKYPLTFQVEQTSGEWWFGNSEIYLYGTLFVEKPQDASYTGYSPGSTTLNWTFPDGTGETWFIDDLQPESGWRKNSAEITFTAIKVLP